MHSLLTRSLLCLWAFFAALASAQSATQSDYVGYNLTLEGDEDSVIYSTANTRADADLIPNPDVYLNASGKRTRETSCRRQLIETQCTWAKSISRSTTWYTTQPLHYCLRIY